MKLSGWKTITGGSIVVSTILPKLAEQFLGLDTGELDQYVPIVMYLGTALWGVGVLDKGLRKVLPYTRKLEKLLEWFNAWAAKQGQKGEVTVKNVSILGGTIALILTANGVQDKAVREKVEAEILGAADSVAAVELSRAKLDTVVARIEPARTDYIRETQIVGKDTLSVVVDSVFVPSERKEASAKWQPKNEDGSPMYFDKGDGIVIEYRRMSTDSLMGRRVVPADTIGLFVDWARFLYSPPPAEPDTLAEPIEVIR